MHIKRAGLFLFIVFVLFQSGAFAQFQMSAQQKELADYIQQNYTKREVMIPMRDGVKLFTSIYEPKSNAEKYPIMFDRTPYSVAPYGADKFKPSLGPNELFAREGYIFVYQDVRGRWASEGEFVDVRPEIARPGTKDIDESTDTYDTIDWLVKNVANNNGRVGMWGISYPGFYTSAGAINSHPDLKAVSPQAPVSDWFHGDDMHHNGALFLAQNYAFFKGFGQPRPGPIMTGDYMKKWQGRDTQDGYDFFLKLGGLKEVDDSYESGLGMRIKFWDEMMEHPNYDQYWKDRNVLTKLKGIKAAVMTVGGWYDNEDLYGALNTYKHIEAQNPDIYNVLVVGPWYHGGWERNEGDFLGTAYF
ncbi:MAG: CocE/NonD family hydrolase, partial [Pyrinomonadaceae bacterium]